ncbi:MAG TPA: SH3 domain-containing protein [Terriglobales bacterium]|nr:SH3 domain-containing protein [Terriglobales bacterium]
MDRIAEQAEIPDVPILRNKLSLRRPRLEVGRLAVVLALFLLLSVAQPLYCGEHKTKKGDEQANFSMAVPAPQIEVVEAVSEVVNDGIIQGSKEYNRDKYVDKASPAASSSLFPPWTDPGQVFYKVRTHVLAPVNFKASNDEGTLAVRYVVQSKDAQQTIVRIDAVFVEDFRHVAHPSNGSVESAEYKDIEDHVNAIELQKKEAAESEQHRQQVLAKRSLEEKKEREEASTPATTPASAETLEQRVQNLRHELERMVKAPGAPLKSAPFSTATNLKSLNGGAQVVILIVTPYWYGVETEEGQHGWISRSLLEPLP